MSIPQVRDRIRGNSLGSLSHAHPNLLCSRPCPANLFPDMRFFGFVPEGLMSRSWCTRVTAAVTLLMLAEAKSCRRPIQPDGERLGFSSPTLRGLPRPILAPPLWHHEKHASRGKHEICLLLLLFSFSLWHEMKSPDRASGQGSHLSNAQGFGLSGFPAPKKKAGLRTSLRTGGRIGNSRKPARKF